MHNEALYVSEKHTVISRWKKVKFFHTRYRTLGPELIPVYGQSSHRLLCKSSPGGRLSLLSARPAKNVTVLRPVPSYTAWWQAHRCELAKLVTQLYPVAFTLIIIIYYWIVHEVQKKKSSERNRNNKNKIVQHTLSQTGHWHRVT